MNERWREDEIIRKRRSSGEICIQPSPADAPAAPARRLSWQNSARFTALLVAILLLIALVLAWHAAGMLSLFESVHPTY